MSGAGSAVLQETIGIDVNRHAHLVGPVDRADPFADDILDVERAARVDEQPETVAAAVGRHEYGAVVAAVAHELTGWLHALLRFL